MQRDKHAAAAAQAAAQLQGNVRYKTCTGKDTNDTTTPLLQPHADVFNQRMQQLQAWLAARPERCIAVVSHWACLQALTGDHFNNCELRTTRASQLQLSRVLL